MKGREGRCTARRAGRIPILAAGSVWLAACSFGLEEPEPREQSFLVASLDGRRGPFGPIALAADLFLGTDARGRDLDLADDTLRAVGARLDPTAVAFGSSGRVVRWRGDVPAAPPGTAAVIEPPGVPGRTPPGDVRIRLLRPADPGADGATWTPGTDLVLPLERVDGADADLVRATRVLHIEYAGSSGLPVRVELRDSTAIGDVVRAPRTALPAVPPDSLEATLELLRSFERTSPDGTYEVRVVTMERVRWRICVEATTGVCAGLVGGLRRR